MDKVLLSVKVKIGLWAIVMSLYPLSILYFDNSFGFLDLFLFGCNVYLLIACASMDVVHLNSYTVEGDDPMRLLVGAASIMFIVLIFFKGVMPSA